jgi:hypothetical protein
VTLDAKLDGHEDDPAAPLRGRCVDIGIVVEGPPAQEQEVMESADDGLSDSAAV